MAQVVSLHRCGSLAHHEQKAGELLKGAVTREYEHLEGLMPSCAATTDVVLCATDGESLVGFPVHKDYISLHSPVISQLLEVLEKGHKGDASLRLPLLNEKYSLYSASTMRAAVGYLYKYFPETDPKCRATPALGLSLQMLPTQADCLRLYHKYGMINMLVAHEKRLESPLKTLLAQSSFGSVFDILEFANSAEETDCLVVSTACEAFMARCSGTLGWQHSLLISKLSRASIIRVYGQVVAGHKQDKQALEASLHTSVVEAEKFSKATFNPQMCCPRCGNGMRRSKAKNIVHQTHGTCRWPRHQPYFKVLS